MRSIERWVAAAVAGLMIMAPLAACTPDPTINPPPAPPPPSTVKLPEGWPDTVKPNQIDTYKKAIAAFDRAGKIIDDTVNDPKATKFPDELSKYADPKGEWVKSEEELLARYRRVGLRFTGPGKAVAVPRANTIWNPNQVGIYVCSDWRQTVTYDVNDKKLGNGRLLHATLTVSNGPDGWRVTRFDSAEKEFTETKQCGQEN